MKAKKCWKQKALSGLAAMLLLSGSLCGCSSTNGETPQEIPTLLDPQNVEITTVEVIRGDILNKSVQQCIVVPETETLSFEIAGTISAIHVSWGDRVKAGDVLAELDETELLQNIADTTEQLQELREQFAEANLPTEEQIATLQAEWEQLAAKAARVTGKSIKKKLTAQAELKKIELGRVQLSFNEVLEAQQAQLTDLETALTEMQEKVGKNQIVAPYDGLIANEISYEVDSYVAEEQAVFVLVDESKQYIEGPYYSEKKYATLVDTYALIGGIQVEVEYIPLTEEEQSQIQSSNVEGATNKNTMRYLVTPAEGQTVSFGETAFFYTVTELVEDVLILPQSVVQRDNLGHYVYVYENGVRVRREVIVGSEDGSYIEIKKGLQEGEEVYAQFDD